MITDSVQVQQNSINGIVAYYGQSSIHLPGVIAPMYAVQMATHRHIYGNTGDTSLVHS